MPESPNTFAFPLAKADLCVKCGLCLPHCPTYQETRNEADSPRGRIMLMQGLASGMIGHSDSLQSHLDGCLSCRSCERVCPRSEERRVGKEVVRSWRSRWWPCH